MQKLSLKSKRDGTKINEAKVKTKINQLGMERESKIIKLGRGVGSGGSLRAVADQGENPTTGNIRSRNVKSRERKGKKT